MTSSPERQAEEPGFLDGLARVMRGWDTFWFRPADPTTLCLIRIFAGMLVFYVHLSYSWGLFDLVGAEGWANLETESNIRSNHSFEMNGFTWNPLESRAPYRGHAWWSPFYHITDPYWIVTLHVIFLTAMLLFTLGLWTRCTGLLTWVGAMAYVQRASVTVFGMDTMMMIVLAYVVLGPSGDALSLDRLFRIWRSRREGLPIPPVSPSILANFAIRLIQVHFCIIYLAGGTSKLLGPLWWNATALNMVVLNYSFAPLYFGPYRSLLLFLAEHRWLWELAGTGGVIYTLFVELSFTFLVWNRNWRWVMVTGSILLHFGIGLMMGLVAFGLFMLVMVFSFFPPEMTREAVERISGMVVAFFREKSSHPPITPMTQMKDKEEIKAR
jgi:Vitamin K-dependent gamma-carboxylase